MTYVDGFVLVVPKKNLAAYRRIAKKAGKIWMEHGALSFTECVADDIKIPFGMPFGKLTKLKANETVVFSYIVYKSRKQRDAVNKKVMTDKRIAGLDPNKMPHDPKRMSFGGFKVLVDL
jgi:uncharacterized protein YbaA (DUF1428 family)